MHEDDFIAVGVPQKIRHRLGSSRDEDARVAAFENGGRPTLCRALIGSDERGALKRAWPQRPFNPAPTGRGMSSIKMGRGTAESVAAMLFS
jgi:hypothetical protein